MFTEGDMGHAIAPGGYGSLVNSTICVRRYPLAVMSKVGGER